MELRSDLVMLDAKLPKNWTNFEAKQIKGVKKVDAAALRAAMAAGP